MNGSADELLLRDARRIASALHPLHAPPRGVGWNVGDVDDFLTPDVALTDAAVLVGLVPREYGLAVLLTRRTDALRNHAGQVSFPGGRVEADDGDAVQAALRETHEEVGIAAPLIDPLGFLDPLVTVTGFRVLPVVAAVRPDYVATPDPAEVAAVFELPLAFLLAPDSLLAHDIEFRGRPRRVHEYVPHDLAPGQRIWGVTASILFNLRQRLGLD